MKKLLVIVIALSWIALLFIGCDTSSPVSLKWRYDTGYHDYYSSSITIADDVIYMGNVGIYLYAVDKNTGKQKWKVYENQAVFSAPSVVDGVVYVGGWNYHLNEKSYLYAIDTTSGKLKWSFEIGEFSLHLYSPIVVDGTVYIGSPDYHLYAIDAESGELKWRYVDEHKQLYNTSTVLITPAPSFANGVVYIASGNNLYALEANSGELKWHFKAKSKITSSPLVDNGVVYVGGDSYYMYAIDSDSGELKWKYETEETGFFESSIIVEDTIYFRCANLFYAVETNSGELKWRFETRGRRGLITASSTVVDGVIYVGTRDYYLYAIDSKSGKQKWGYEVEGPIDSNIIINDGVIYYGCRDGYLYAMEIKK